MEDEPHELLVRVLAQPLDEAVRRERHPRFVCREAVLGEAEVEERGHWNGAGAQLLLLLGVIRTANVADGYLLAEGVEEGQSFRGDKLRWGLLVGGLEAVGHRLT